MNNVLFVQRKAHRAGAQSCIERVLRFDAEYRKKTALLCGESGWLTEACARTGVPVVIEPMPNSRSLAARLYGNAAFARHAAERLQSQRPSVRVVHANDHNEGLLGLALSDRLAVQSAIFLRSSAMTQHDYFKYGCNRYDLVIAVGEDLQRAAQSWDRDREVRLIHDGIFENEFSAPEEKLRSPPERVLVIGHAGEAKGWGDLAEALSHLEARSVRLPAFDFTGDCAGKPYAPLLQRLRAGCRMLERPNDFKALLKNYRLVINPSRNESFGMAAIEVLAAGVPLVSSRTGVIEQVLHNREILFEPRSPSSLAETLRHVLEQWNGIDFGLEQAQKAIRRKFSIEQAWAKLEDAYRALSNGAG